MRGGCTCTSGDSNEPLNLEIYIYIYIYIVRDILVQCNRPKPTPACTSSLGFSCIYILMLGFIITQVLYYTLIQ